MTESKQNHWTLSLAALCWVVGWSAAVAYGHGFEFQRMVVAIPGVVMAGIILLAVRGGQSRVWVPGILLAGVTALYFAGRATVSPVWDLGKTDLLLVCLGFLSIWVGAGIAHSGRAVGVFLGGLVVLFLANVGVALLQGTSDPGFAFLRMPRVDQQGVSGLFWHRNYLAGMLELVVPVFLAVALAHGRIPVRIGFGIAVVAGLVLAYASHSRAGLVSVAIGCGVVLFVWLLRGWGGWSMNARIGVLFAGVAAMALLLVGALALASKISVQRGQSESLETSLGNASERLAFAGIAYEQWQENPLLGMGARTFSNYSVRNWDRGRTHQVMGNPEMVHNDYLQTLAEYGAVGLVLIMGVGGVALGRGMTQVWARERAAPAMSGIVQIGAIGGLCGGMAHSSVDFSLHILPNTLLLGLLLGFAFRSTGEAVDRWEENRRNDGRPPGVRDGNGGTIGRVVIGVCVVLATTGSFIAGGRELLVLPAWFSFEQGAITGGITPDEKADLKKIIEKAPDFGLLRYYGRITLAEMRADPEAREALVPDALWAMEAAVERHPFDGESWLNYAVALDAGGDSEEAAGAFLRAIEETWRRENKYGGMRAFSDHLARRAEEYWQARKPGRALAFYRRASEYQGRSWELSFRRGVYREAHEEYLRNRKYLSERIEFLEGAGIEAESLHGEIPPPPDE